MSPNYPLRLYVNLPDQNHNATTVLPDISVLVPVMNEQGNIRPLIDEITAVYAGRSFEIIYVDDGSDDGTADELNNAAAAVKQLQVFTHERRTGQSAALRTALYKARAPLIAVLDGDGQNIPSDLPALEAALLISAPARGWPLACVWRVKIQE